MQLTTLIWDVNLDSLIGKKVRLDTGLGSTLTGTVRSISYKRALVLDGRSCTLPDRVHLDNGDHILFSNINSLELSR